MANQIGTEQQTKPFPFLSLSLFFSYTLFSFRNYHFGTSSRIERTWMYGRPVKRRFSKRNSCNIRKTLVLLRPVWIEKMHRIVCDSTTSARKRKTISSYCVNHVSVRAAHATRKNPIKHNRKALWMHWRRVSPPGKADRTNDHFFELSIQINCFANKTKQQQQQMTHESWPPYLFFYYLHIYVFVLH